MCVVPWCVRLELQPPCWPPHWPPCSDAGYWHSHEGRSCCLARLELQPHGPQGFQGEEGREDDVIAMGFFNRCNVPSHHRSRTTPKSKWESHPRFLCESNPGDDGITMMCQSSGTASDETPACSAPAPVTRRQMRCTPDQVSDTPPTSLSLSQASAHLPLSRAHPPPLSGVVPGSAGGC